MIYVGGSSDIEQKELYDRVDDAVCAVKSALEEGILPGGGVALYNNTCDMNEFDKDDENSVACKIMCKALRAPMTQIMDNADLDVDDIISEVIFDGKQGYDVKNNQYGDMFEMGIVDPAKVTKNALQNAVSVATTILSTNAIVTLARTYESGE